MEIEDSSIILAYIPLKKFNSDKSDDDSDIDEEWIPVDKNKKKVTPPPKFNPIKIDIINPKPVRNLNDLIEILENCRDRENKAPPVRKSKRINKSVVKFDDNPTPTKKHKHNSNKSPTKKHKHNLEKSKDRKRKEKPPTVVEGPTQIDELIMSLKELEGMIGMESIKQNIVNQLLLFLQNLNDPGMFLHTVLTGNPGCGKTSICHILAKIYKSMGFIQKSDIVVADRPALIGQWLGETSIKTKKVLDSARGGVLLIDEAYSLGNEEGRDSFSKECIDTINQYLSEHVDEFVCIIAGYKDDLNKCFF